MSNPLSFTTWGKFNDIKRKHQFRTAARVPERMLPFYFAVPSVAALVNKAPVVPKFKTPARAFAAPAAQTRCAETTAHAQTSPAAARAEATHAHAQSFPTHAHGHAQCPLAADQPTTCYYNVMWCKLSKKKVPMPRCVTQRYKV